jgi:phosphoglycolate phosphatase-like HAD superfamily hydrolase
MPLDTSRVAGLIFDMDGTLSDTDDQMVDRLARLLKPLGPLFPGKNAQAVARWLVMAVETPGNFFYGIPDRLGLDDKLDYLVNALIRRSKSQTHPHFRIIPGVEAMLANLAARYPLALVSVRDSRGTNAFIEQYHLGPFFKAVATSLTCRRTKPFPDPLLWAAEQMDVPASGCVMIGDTAVDVRAGKAAGAQTVGVLCGFGTRNELLRAGADAILHSTADLPGVFFLPEVGAYDDPY